MQKTALVMGRVGENVLGRIQIQLGDCPRLWLRLGLRHLLVCGIAIIHVWCVYSHILVLWFTWEGSVANWVKLIGDIF